MLSDYREIHPSSDESAQMYGKRLEENGYEEMYIRKALAYHFNMRGEQALSACENFQVARLRHITMLRRMFPNMTPYAFQRKVSKNLGLTDDMARHWIETFNKVGEVEYCEDYAKTKPR